MSRIPRFQEHMKTGFTAEAVSAARFRAYAEQAEGEGLPNLARRWRRLAEEKDRLAIDLLTAARQVKGLDADLGSAIAEERYENEILYPKMIRDVADEQVSDIFLRAISAQREHLRRMEELRRDYHAAQGDVALPAEVDEGTRVAEPARV